MNNFPFPFKLSWDGDKYGQSAGNQIIINFLNKVSELNTLKYI